MSDQVLVQGRLLSRSSCQLKRDGEEFFGWDTMEWGQSRERGKAYGSGKAGGPRGKTGGRYAAKELVIGFHQDTALAVKKSLAREASDSKSYGNVSHMWTLTVSEPGLETQLYEWTGCTLDDESGGAEDSAEKMLEKFTFGPMRMKHNGLSLYDQSQEG